ncbi:WxL domain-containing protein [Latilactobacillus sakei]|uniref:WxL domain-containing protein n=2 Tax=Latilactobacillus sakei TaxID=1599 RepID=A0AAF0GMD2_LATSK|nr:WxL domain-containing protein [Latilactobacillus sakei]WGI19030.1 WxL domain-containing protein [Latilactobacillus sakei]
MKKRIIYSLLIIFLLMTTVVQSLGAVLATSSTQDGDDSVKTSKIIDSTKAITQVSGSSQLRSSSQSIVQSSSEQQTSKKSESKKSSEKKASSKKQVKSVLIQPRAITETDPYTYPDFSKTLSSQQGVITVNYDASGNAHTSIADASGTLKPDDSYNEIPYPNNAFPSFIPGVSTETDYGQTKSSKDFINGNGLDGDKDYIYYTKVMAFRDENGKQHWIDIKQKFVGLEKHGWYNDWPQWKTQGYSDPNGTTLDTTYITNWGFNFGRGTNKGNQNRQDMLGINGSFQAPGGFRTTKIKSSAGGILDKDPKAYLQYRQLATVKLEFYDNETKKPISISGFLTVADLDHRDFLQFSKDSNIQGVYVTNNQVTKSTLKGTFGPGMDPSTVIVNNIGNNEYTDRNGGSANNGDEWGDSNEVINPDNTDAWATVTFSKTQSIQYAVSDWQRLDFLASALVPVAFSAPGKSGDGDEWNKDWDDNNINYNVVATLPYRGSTIKNPQHGTAESGTISTFHPTEKFELTDPINKNLKVDKVTIMQDGVTDVTANFDIDTTGNKVTAKAKADFLGKEDNYAKTYNMKIETSVAADADLGSLPTVTATDDKGVKHTYAKIANTAHLDVVKTAGAKAEGWDSNEAFGHVKVPDPVREVQDMKQEIKNYDTAGEDWQPIVDDASTTTGHVGDKVGYRFSFKAKDSNTASITDASINAISVNAGISVPTNVKVKVGSTTTDGTVVEGSTANTYSIKIDTPIKKGEAVTVTFERTLNKSGLYMQIGFLKSDSLTAKPDGHDLVPDGYLFNTAVITASVANNTATIQQFIRNPATALPGQAWNGPGFGDGKAETTGKPGDYVIYRFDITLPTDSTSGKYTNDAALVNAAIQDITMNMPDDLELVSLEGYPDKQIQINYGGTIIRSAVSDTLATLKGIALKSPLDVDKKVMVQYRVLIKDNAKTQDITNDANFYADNLTGDLTDKTVANYQHKTKANQSKLKIRNKKEVKLEQTLKNMTTEDTSTSTDPKYPDKDGYRLETTAGKGDIIDYRYKVTAADDNTGNITNMKVNAITMKKSDKLSFSDPDTGKDYPLIVKISKADGTNETTDTNAKFSADHQTITLSQPLKPGYMATISYQMQVTASVDDNTLAADKVVTNDAKLTADELTETKTTSTGTENALIAGNTMTFNQTVLNLKKNVGEIIIRYVDLEDNDLKHPTYIASEVDEKGTSGTKLSTVNSARVAPKIIEGYTIHAVTEDTDLTNANWSKAYKDDPVFTDKVRTITYGYYKRMLSVEAPSYWDFGTHNRTQTDSTYYLEDRKTPQAVKVTDHYGVDSWQLQVTQEKPFMDDRKQVLKDAELQFKNGNVIADASNTTPAQAMSSIDHFELKTGDTVKNLMTYTKSGVFQDVDLNKDKSSETNRYSDDQGKGSWYYQFGDKKNADISIGLHVPETTERDNTTYTTTLDWTLTVAP